MLSYTLAVRGNRLWFVVCILTCLVAVQQITDNMSMQIDAWVLNLMSICEQCELFGWQVICQLVIWDGSNAVSEDEMGKKLIITEY